MRRTVSIAAVMTAVLAAGQALGGGQMGRPGGMVQPQEQLSSEPHQDKADVAAKKAFTAAMKSLTKAQEFDATAATAATEDKRARAAEKANDAYYRALDLFTFALSNQGDLGEAWNKVCGIHLRIGAYREALDDCEHAMKLLPQSTEVVEYRALALLHLHYLDDAEAAYMDLFNHARERADRVLAAMQKWLVERRLDAEGIRPAQLDQFDRWLQERLKAAAP